MQILTDEFIKDGQTGEAYLGFPKAGKNLPATQETWV